MNNKSNKSKIRKKKLNRFYCKIMRQAWQNEKVLSRMQHMELRLMQCESLAELLQTLIHDCQIQFELNKVTLILVDSDNEIECLLSNYEPGYHKRFPDLFFHNTNQKLLQLFEGELALQLKPFDPNLYTDFIKSPPQHIQSIALLPLKYNDHILGGLILGDSQPERFSAQSSTDFLQHLCSVISICINMSILRDRLKYNSLNDALTGINNRRFFDQRLLEEISRCKRLQKPISCLFIDVDHFKQFNDNFGHASGDMVLKQVACIIRHALRKSDIVGRYGGEEFAILLPDTGHRNAVNIAERIRESIQNHNYKFDKHQLQVTVSIGIADFQKFADENKTLAEIAELLIAAADSALYKAKQSGRNCIAINED
ncbi:MAG: sensor domain-containing diguanylate cyclase [Burkholderiales bacterium]|nr:sensor domain-containing diguanylate cyclase [Burkholderiales bacterium]MDR4518444.1 sensor domain-containing diguanylate cyclase [Nitrosomonas sp.]